MTELVHRPALLESEASRIMFYRILDVPPGYPPHHYMVAKYETLEFKNCSCVFHTDGTKFFPMLEEARKAIPAGARQLPFQREHQFVELWESPEHVE